MVHIAISVGEVCIRQGDSAGTSGGHKVSGKDRGDAYPRLSARSGSPSVLLAERATTAWHPRQVCGGNRAVS